MPHLQSTPGSRFSFPCDPLGIRDACYRALVSDFGKARVEGGGETATSQAGNSAEPWFWGQHPDGWSGPQSAKKAMSAYF